MFTDMIWVNVLCWYTRVDVKFFSQFCVYRFRYETKTKADQLLPRPWSRIGAADGRRAFADSRVIAELSACLSESGPGRRASRCSIRADVKLRFAGSIEPTDAMPLTLAELQDIQADCMADDIVIDFEKMSLWTNEQAISFFETGNEPPPPCALNLEPILEETGLAGSLSGDHAAALAAAQEQGRMACLALLKELGVAKLGDRQKLATAIAKAIKKDATSAAEALALQEREAAEKARARAKEEAEAAAAKAALPWGGMEIIPADQLKPPPPRGKFVAEGTGRPKLPPWVPQTDDVVAAGRNPKVAQPTPFKTHLQAKSRTDWEAAVDAMYKSGVGPVGHFYDLRFVISYALKPWPCPCAALLTARQPLGSRPSTSRSPSR